MSFVVFCLAVLAVNCYTVHGIETTIKSGVEMKEKIDADIVKFENMIKSTKDAFVAERSAMKAKSFHQKIAAKHAVSHMHEAFNKIESLMMQKALNQEVYSVQAECMPYLNNARDVVNNASEHVEKCFDVSKEEELLKDMVALIDENIIELMRHKRMAVECDEIGSIVHCYEMIMEEHDEIDYNVEKFETLRAVLFERLRQKSDNVQKCYQDSNIHESLHNIAPETRRKTLECTDGEIDFYKPRVMDTLVGDNGNSE